MKTNSLAYLIFLFSTCHMIYGASYDTLPKGVSTLVLKQVVTNTIESKYDANNNDKLLVINETFTSSKLSEISDIVKKYFEELNKLSNEAYSSFTLGEYEAKASAQVNAQGLGVGHGITNRLSVYTSLPMYHLKTDVHFYQKTPGNLNVIKNAVFNSNPKGATGTFVKQLTLQLPESNESLLQSVVVNYYKYKPLGTWEKDSLGDAEIGMIYRLTNFSQMGSSITGGIVIPTGTPDDPDSLQDISTGDGQYDFFIESNNGVSFFHQILSFDLKGRFTYQIGKSKTLRLYDDIDLPISLEKKTIYEKLGNKWDATATMTVNPNIWTHFYTSYIFNKTGGTTYEISDSMIKKAMESNTESTTHWLKIGIGLSTIELYKRKRFELPLEIGISAQRPVEAKNAANYNRYDLDFKFYF